jgi:hypothetical protein
MYVPFGWLSFFAGLLGFAVYVLRRVQGLDILEDTALLTATAAALAAGWMACVTLPRLRRQIDLHLSHDTTGRTEA